MKKLLLFVPVFLFLASCVKETATPKPTKASITEVKVTKFPTTDGGKAWDANAINTTATAPDMYFEILGADAKTVLKNRTTVTYVDNVTLTTLPTWTISPKFDLKTLSDKVSINFYDQDSGILDSTDDLMGTCTLDMVKETISSSSFPKTVTIDNGAGLAITLSLEYTY
jgi:hypothetical protein